jgi:hypothetical protein
MYRTAPAYELPKSRYAPPALWDFGTSSLTEFANPYRSRFRCETLWRGTRSFAQIAPELRWG